VRAQRSFFPSLGGPLAALPVNCSVDEVRTVALLFPLRWFSFPPNLPDLTGLALLVLFSSLSSLLPYLMAERWIFLSLDSNLRSARPRAAAGNLGFIYHPYDLSPRLFRVSFFLIKVINPSHQYSRLLDHLLAFFLLPRRALPRDPGRSPVNRF